MGTLSRGHQLRMLQWGRGVTPRIYSDVSKVEMGGGACFNGAAESLRGSTLAAGVNFRKKFASMGPRSHSADLQTPPPSPCPPRNASMGPRSHSADLLLAYYTLCGADFNGLFREPQLHGTPRRHSISHLFPFFPATPAKNPDREPPGKFPITTGSRKQPEMPANSPRRHRRHPVTATESAPHPSPISTISLKICLLIFAAALHSPRHTAITTPPCRVKSTGSPTARRSKEAWSLTATSSRPSALSHLWWTPLPQLFGLP